MENHPDLARGFAKGDRCEIEQLWAELTENLNSSGPPQKEVVAWKKVNIKIIYKIYVKIMYFCRCGLI